MYIILTTIMDTEKHPSKTNMCKGAFQVRKFKYVLPVAMIIIFFTEIVFCASPITTTSIKIFELLPDARSGALGGAYTAISDDSGAIFYNPAGLANINHNEFSFEQNALYNKIDQRFIGFTYSLRDWRTTNLDNPGTISVLWETLSQGFYPIGDQNGNFISNPSSNGELMSGAYGKTLVDDESFGALMIGATAKLYNEESFNSESAWQTYDAGLIWKCPCRNLSVGGSILNLNKNLNRV